MLSSVNSGIHVALGSLRNGVDIAVHSLTGVDNVLSSVGTRVGIAVQSLRTGVGTATMTVARVWNGMTEVIGTRVAHTIDQVIPGTVRHIVSIVAKSVHEDLIAFGDAGSAVVHQWNDAGTVAEHSVRSLARGGVNAVSGAAQHVTIVWGYAQESAVNTVSRTVSSMVQDFAFITTALDRSFTHDVREIAAVPSAITHLGRKAWETVSPSGQEVVLPPPVRYRTSLRKAQDGRILISALSVSVLNSLGVPYANTPVVLFSEPKVATTNEGGIATFHDVEIGEHTLEVHVAEGKVERRSLTIEPPAAALVPLESMDVVLPVAQVLVASTREDSSALLPWLIFAAVLFVSSNVFWLVYRFHGKSATGSFLGGRRPIAALRAPAAVAMYRPRKKKRHSED